jgi:hypothetical protein
MMLLRVLRSVGIFMKSGSFKSYFCLIFVFRVSVCCIVISTLLLIVTAVSVAVQWVATCCFFFVVVDCEFSMKCWACTYRFYSCVCS